MFHDFRRNRRNPRRLHKPAVPEMTDKTFAPRGAPAPFVVVESNPIIAADLAQSIGECPGGGPAITVRDHAGAQAELSSPGPRIAVFLPGETGDEQAAALALDPFIRVHGASVVVMSGTLCSHQAELRGWHLLPLPFTPAMVHAVIAALSASSSQPTPPAP